MKINIASKNPAKINALKELIKDYILLSAAEIVAIDADSGVRGQPIGLNETVQGAVNRAKNSFQNCRFSFGIESGLIEVPYSKSGYMDVTACVIYDGKNFHLGLSSSFEYPRKVTELVMKNGLEISSAYKKAGLFDGDFKLGEGMGAIGLLTKGRMDRKEYTKQAIVTALIHLENEI